MGPTMRGGNTRSSGEGEEDEGRGREERISASRVSVNSSPARWWLTPLTSTPSPSLSLVSREGAECAVPKGEKMGRFGINTAWDRIAKLKYLHSFESA